MKLSKTSRLAWACAAFISLQACSSEPTGQVLAVVNGEEITQSELNAEIAGLSIPPVGDKDAIRRQILQQLVERRLMAQVAKEEGFDRDPEFVSRERRMREELLVRMYGQKIAETVGVPDKAAVTQYLAANPGKFSQRASLTVDQVVFDYPSDQKVLKALEPTKSLSEVEQVLAGLKINYERRTNSLDTAALPNPALQQILALPPGEPFVIPTEGKITVSVITGRQALTTSEQEAAPIAAQAIRTENLSKVLQSRLEEARAKASISYQPGLEPTTAAAPATPGT